MTIKRFLFPVFFHLTVKLCLSTWRELCLLNLIFEQFWKETIKDHWRGIFLVLIPYLTWAPEIPRLFVFLRVAFWKMIVKDGELLVISWVQVSWERKESSGARLSWSVPNPLWAPGSWGRTCVSWLPPELQIPIWESQLSWWRWASRLPLSHLGPSKDRLFHHTYSGVLLTRPSVWYQYLLVSTEPLTWS